MVSWEYEFVRHNLYKSFIDELNKAGVEGWELVAVEKDAQHYYMGFLKRRVPSPDGTTEHDEHHSIPDNGEMSLEEASRRAAFNRIFNHDK